MSSKVVDAAELIARLSEDETVVESTAIAFGGVAGTAGGGCPRTVIEIAVVG